MLYGLLKIHFFFFIFIFIIYLENEFEREYIYWARTKFSNVITPVQCFEVNNAHWITRTSDCVFCLLNN